MDSIRKAFFPSSRAVEQSSSRAVEQSSAPVTGGPFAGEKIEPIDENTRIAEKAFSPANDGPAKTGGHYGDLGFTENSAKRALYLEILKKHPQQGDHFLGLIQQVKLRDPEDVMDFKIAHRSYFK